MSATVTEARAAVERKKGERNRAAQQFTACESALAVAVSTLDNANTAHALVQAVAQQTQQALEYRLGELVTLALCAVFGEGWKFRVKFELRRGRTEADLVFEDADGHQIDPISADGGGAVDVATLALRVSLWSLRRPRSRATLVFDEPFLHLSKDRWARMITVLREISARLELQLLIVTHEDAMREAADRTFVVKPGRNGAEVSVG